MLILCAHILVNEKQQNRQRIRFNYRINEAIQSEHYLLDFIRHHNDFGQAKIHATKGHAGLFRTIIVFMYVAIN